MVNADTKKELKNLGKLLTYAQKQHISVITRNSLSTVCAYVDGDCAKQKTADEILTAIKELKKDNSKVFIAQH